MTVSTSRVVNQVFTRDDLALRYLDQLPFTPYPVQEQALLTWFSTDEGVLVCTPTGTGKTLIAEAAAFEALHTGRTMYYTTPLIALTEQKFAEMQRAAVRWGFAAEQVGLVTGNRRVNPGAKVLVVVAEILLNRLLHVADHSPLPGTGRGAGGEGRAITDSPTVSPSDTRAPHPNPLPQGERELQGVFDFDDVTAVVMDEFHSFSDFERGIVWEFALSLLPKHVRLLLLSATVGNSIPFLTWLRQCHHRNLELVQSTDRRIPLSFHWVPDKLLNELLVDLAEGDAETRRTPALVFCFNREECWNTAEELKGKAMLSDGQQKLLVEQLAKYDWSKGAGPKFKQILMRGVGVHHAGVLPRYKRIVEDLFQKKLLSVCVCTETLAAGINLPARSVVLPSLMKGKPGKQKILEPSAAHQMFGRAGRPQFDKEGFVYALPHEDDVKILRWREKFDAIPADTKDPNLLKAKKSLKKKEPKRSPERQYWNQQQFDKLRQAPPGDLASRGPVPWRLLAYLLQLSPDVDRLRTLVRKRLMDPKLLDAGEQQLERMLITLHAGDFIKLEPEPPAVEAPLTPNPSPPGGEGDTTAPPQKPSWIAQQLLAIHDQRVSEKTGESVPRRDVGPELPRYRPLFARPTERLEQLFVFRSVNPLYGMFLLEHFDIADERERMQMWESVLELPPSLLRSVRAPNPKRMPPGPLATTRVDQSIVQRGILPAGDLYPEWDPDALPEERKYAPSLAEKLRMLFDAEYPGVSDVFVQGVWAAGELLEFGGDFFQYVTTRDLTKQEGLVFRHVLRLVLLLNEFAQLTPPNVDPQAWRDQLRDLAARLTEACRQVDPDSTDSALQHATDPDLIRAETSHATPPPALLVAVPPAESSQPADEFGAGLLETDDG
jgi:superfamily II DNA/RNA helicase